MAPRRLTIEPATLAHAREIAPRLRAADVAEVAALWGMEPYEAITVSLATSTEAYTGLEDGVPGAIWGVRGDALGRTGLIWALGTDALSNWPVALIKNMRMHIEDWGGKYGMLTNIAHKDNRASLALLRRLGFTMTEPDDRGAVTFWRIS